jgi:hypothetical protein
MEDAVNMEPVKKTVILLPPAGRVSATGSTSEISSGGRDDEKEAARTSVRTSLSLNELDAGRFVVETVDIIMWLLLLVLRGTTTTSASPA